MNNARGYLVVSLLILLVFAGLAVSQRERAALLAERTRLRAQVAQANAAATQSRELASADISPEQLEVLRHEAEEVKRLRAEAGALRARLSRPEEKRSAAPADGPWRNVGAATPEDAVRTTVWAALQGETGVLARMLAFDRESEAAVRAFFATLPAGVRAEYGSAENVAATMLAARMPLDLKNAKPVEQVVDQGGGLAVRFELQRNHGPAKSVVFRFRRDSDGWRLIVPRSVLMNLRKALTSP
jgi:hypothetical protein